MLNVKDVINDAHNTFLREGRIDSSEEENQIQEIIKERAFNWSDEDDNNNQVYSDEEDSHHYYEGQGYGYSHQQDTGE